METLKDLQLEHLMVSVVRAVPALVVSTIVSVAVYVPVAPGAPALPVPVLMTKVAVLARSAAPVAYSERKFLEQHLELWTGSHLVHMMG